jgi:Gpi18-like mannosyltransferase
VTPSARTVFIRIVVLALLVRVALEVVGLASLAAHGQPTLGRGLDMWSQWDAPHYLRIAEIGYRPRSVTGDDPLFIVFFPLFPLAVRIVAFAARNLVLSGMIVSLLASVGACWFLYRLVAIDRDHAEAWRAVVLLVSFPTAYFMAAPYTEALFLFGILASVYAARTDRWARAGLAGALATGTRVSGVALAPALVAEAFASPGKRVRRLGWIALAGAGLAGYLVVNRVVYHDWFWFLTVQRTHWFQRAVAPWQTLVDAVRALITGPPNNTITFIYWGRLAGFAFAVTLLIAGLRRLRAADSIYAWTSLVLVLSATWLISLPRYLLAIYPLFIVGARLTRARTVFWPVVVLGAGAQAWLFTRYSVGHWTF